MGNGKLTKAPKPERFLASTPNRMCIYSCFVELLDPDPFHATGIFTNIRITWNKRLWEKKIDLGAGKIVYSTEMLGTGSHSEICPLKRMWFQYKLLFDSCKFKVHPWRVWLFWFSWGSAEYQTSHVTIIRNNMEISAEVKLVWWNAAKPEHLNPWTCPIEFVMN